MTFLQECSMADLKKYLMISLPTVNAYRLASGEWKQFIVEKDNEKIPEDYKGPLVICSNEESGETLQDSLSIIALVTVAKIERHTGAFTKVTVESPVQLIEAPFRAKERYLDWFWIPEEILVPYPDPKNIARWRNKEKVW